MLPKRFVWRDTPLRCPCRDGQWQCACCGRCGSVGAVPSRTRDGSGAARRASPAQCKRAGRCRLRAPLGRAAMRPLPALRPRCGARGNRRDTRAARRGMSVCAAARRRHRARRRCAGGDCGYVRQARKREGKSKATRSARQKGPKTSDGDVASRRTTDSTGTTLGTTTAQLVLTRLSGRRRIVGSYHTPACWQLISPPWAERAPTS